VSSSRSVVLIVSNLGIGGAERQLFYLAAGLRKRGWEVTIAIMIPWLAPSFAAELEALGVPVEILQTEVAARPRPLLRAIRAFSRLLAARRPDVVIGFMPHGALLARIMGRAARVPKVFTSLRNQKSTHRWHDWLLALTRGLDQGSVTNSAVAAAAQVRAGVTTAAKSAVIFNGFDPARVDTTSGPGTGNAEFTWLNIGVLRYEKDHRGLLEAAKELSRTHRFRLQIAGEGDLMEPLKQQARQLGIDDRVEFLGKRSEIADLIRNSDAFVMCSLWEGLPNVLLEAHAGGLPAVATAVGGCCEVVQDGISGFLLPPSDPLRLADAMRRVMALSPDERARMGAAGREHVLSNFSMEKMVESWERLISQ
jgi:glycosyltransferase involved in cell wall biosynthesis